MLVGDHYHMAKLDLSQLSLQLFDQVILFVGLTVSLTKMSLLLFMQNFISRSLIFDFM